MLYSAMPLTALIPNELLGKFRKGSSPGSKSGILCPHATEAKHVPASWMIQKAECIMGVRAGPWVAGGSRKALLTVLPGQQNCQFGDMGRQGKDYARVLGLLKEPTEEEVKRAFRRLALKYHPDKVLTEGNMTQNQILCSFSFSFKKSHRD